MSVYFNDLDHAIFFTLSYSDCFNFPLTKTEINRRLPQVWDWPFLTGQKLKTSKLVLIKSATDIDNSLKKLEKKQKISKLTRDNVIYYFLKGRRRLVKLRLSKAKASQKRQLAINQASHWLERFPTIKAVFLTGSSALDNASLNDDLDFCLIVKKNTLWISRFFVILLAKILGKQPQIDSPVKNNNKRAWCFNLWLDESSLNIVKRGFSIYQAYELVQMRCLFDKDHVAEKILIDNKQLAELLDLDLKNKPTASIKNKISAYCLWPINYLFYLFQRIYRYLLFAKENYFLNLYQAHFNESHRQEKVFKKIEKKMKVNVFSDL